MFKFTNTLKGASVLTIAAVMATTAAHAQDGADLGISDADYSLDALIEAAQQEGPITVIDATGQIVNMAEAFTEKYGIEAVGVRMSAQEQEQILVREAAANNVQTDVFNMSNLPSITSSLLPQGIVVSWFPPDFADVIAPEHQSPALTSHNPWLWAYNSDVHPDGCPVDNMWALTEPEWAGKVAFPDPQLRNETIFWFNQMETNSDEQMAQAYEAYFGEPLETEEASATAEWVKRFAGNNPTIARGDSDVGPIVGASTEDDSRIGFLSTAIFRHAERDGYNMAVCEGMQPFVGQLAPRVAVIAAGTQHPNAAKLFARFMMTEEGMLPQLQDGKISTNADANMPEMERSGVINLVDQLHMADAATADSDFARLQDWQDFWIVNSR
ncbi:ABC transporter substrate-binding protein [Pelagibacterium lentulum]|uniref:ABC transporter substrate-binding protein n=1 Tax=Pelagibacterium lentulum TaxID=2029865 RepID=A0A916RMP0_9HYPH|nr:ABC transporter substrate-binding protein [Pelagibacterium lentulum]GGA62310.1 ABC transporter substrate-binding protein [Pelagibacterium lentulum]